MTCPVLSLIASNCHVMKLMFCGIYNLVLMVMVSRLIIPMSSSSVFFPFFLLHCILTWHSFVLPGTKDTLHEGSLISFFFVFDCFVFHSLLCLTLCPLSFLKQQCARNTIDFTQIQMVVKCLWHSAQMPVYCRL